MRRARAGAAERRIPLGVQAARIMFEPDVQVVMRHESVRLVPQRIRVVRHVVEFTAVIHWRVMVAGVPCRSKDQYFNPSEFQPTIPVRDIKQDRRRFDAGISARAVDPPVDRRGQAQEIRADIMEAHRAQRRVRFAGGRANIAVVGGVGDALVVSQLALQLLQCLVGLGSRYVGGRGRCNQRR